jgi:hypothetical protein
MGLKTERSPWEYRSQNYYNVIMSGILNTICKIGFCFAFVTFYPFLLVRPLVHSKITRLKNIMFHFFSGNFS